MTLSLSVITICFNNLADLRFTCRSVEEQALPPDEHLIIDGSSNEEILNWLQSAPQPPYRRWIHERDKGISDAFNKGITHARGDITHLLNSGDSYADQHATEKAMAAFAADPDLMWLHSRYIQHRGNMDVISGLPFEKEKLWKGMRTVAHPSMFIRKAVYEKHGLYSTDHKIAMDYDMLVRMRNEKNSYLPYPLVYFAPGGASDSQFSRGLQEVKRSHNSYIGSSFRLVFWQWRQRLLHQFMKTPWGRKWFRWKNKKMAARPKTSSL